ncbi:MAG: dipeptidyl carboxypeptidase II, partial [Verrucomicrobia bacterium RIFCSPLOWO2_12_FULL_64_8]
MHELSPVSVLSHWCALGPIWLCLTATLPAADPPPAVPAGNPLLTPSALPFQLPPFDRIRDEHFLPALEQSMARQRQDVDAIAQNSEPPAFDNTIVALERSGRLYDLAGKTFDNLTNANTDPTMQEVDRIMAPKRAAHTDAIHLNAKLFARIQTLYEKRDALGLDPESKRLLERYHKDFVRAGAMLPAVDQAKLKALNAEIATLETIFDQNVLKERNAGSIFVQDPAELAGLSSAEIAAAADTAKKDGRTNGYVLRLLNTTGQPALASLTNRALREKIMEASLARGSQGGEFDNHTTVARLARLRAGRAALLGYPNHAAYQLEEQTAHDVPSVNKILADLAAPAVANARREAADMQALIDREHGGFQLAACDWAFYAEKVHLARYAFDEESIKPYFELNHVVLDGVFYAAHRLYGISFKERHDLPVYQPDVRVFEVSDADGSPLALFLLDPFARPSKKGGAWMSSYVAQSGLFGTKPVVANHLNIPKPVTGGSALLTFDEVTTAFHEFGHALHGMFSHVRYPRFSGTQVPRDFVEYPSQVNEMWSIWPEVLKNYAKHYQTGAPMPPELLEKVLAAQKFNQGYATTEYLAAALLDQAWHQLGPAAVPAADQV